MKLVTWGAAGRLLGIPAGFIGFYIVAVTLFPPENEVDSMILAIPFLLGACVTALISAWLGGRLFDRFGHAIRRRPETK